MADNHLFGCSISMSNEFNVLSKKVEIRSSKKKKFGKIDSNKESDVIDITPYLPLLISSLGSASSMDKSSASQMLNAAVASVGVASKIYVQQGEKVDDFLLGYKSSLMYVTNGAYSINGAMTDNEFKSLILKNTECMLEKADPAFTEWKQVLTELMQKATIKDFMKGIQTTNCAMIGDPVNANTGNFVYEIEVSSVKGDIPLSFKCSYNRIDTRVGCMGRGWRHNYEIQILIENDRYVILWEDGREEIYLKDEEDTPVPLFGIPCRLKRNKEAFFYEKQEGIIYTFDATGKLLKQEDIHGERLRFTYNKYGRLCYVHSSCKTSLGYDYDSNSGKLICVKDHAGKCACITYELGRLKEIKNSAGTSYFYCYDSDKNICSIRNSRGKYVLENSYDYQGRTIKQTFADGGEILYAYQDGLSRTLVTEQNGNKVAYVHDERFRNVETVYIDGQLTGLYNERGQLISKTDKNGNKTNFSYDNKGNTIQVTYSDGEMHNMTYDAGNRLLKVSINGITKLENTYDTKGNLIKMIEFQNRCRLLEYDETGKPIKLTQPNGNIILLAYDDRGNLNRIIDAVGNCTTYEYDDCNRVIHATNGNGNRTSFSYDKNNQITSVTNAAGYRRTYDYTENGKVTKVTDFDGSVILQKYNQMNKVRLLTLPEGETIIMEYDLMQNVTRKVLPDGTDIVYVYDSLNRLVQNTFPTGEMFRYEYDLNGNRSAVIDSDGKQTAMEYDERDRLTRVTDPSGISIEYEYDMEGHLVSVTNADGKSNTYLYDEAGQVIRETDILGNTTSYEYNDIEKLSCVIDSKKQKICFEYTPEGHLSKTIYPDGTFETYSFDKNGNLTYRQNHKGDFLKLTYNCLDQLISIKNSFGQEKKYTYNPVGNVTSTTDTMGNVTHYEYSLGGILTTVIDAVGNRTEYNHDSMGNMVTICQHEGKIILLEEERSNPYDVRGIHPMLYKRTLLGRMENIANALELQEHCTYDLAERMTLKKDMEGYKTLYAYNPEGEIGNVICADGCSVAFTYSLLCQLIKVQEWIGTATVELDEIGKVKTVIDYKGWESYYQRGKIGVQKTLGYSNGWRMGNAILL